jgi:hypothetical protein
LLADPAVFESPAPVPVLGVTDAVDIALSVDHGAAVLAEGSVVYWNHGTAPKAVPGVSDAVRVTILGTGNQGQPAVCALRVGGTVVCWAGASVADVSDLSDVVQISVGLYGEWTVARTADGRVFVVDPSTATATLMSIHDVVDISAAHEGFCAVHADGSVACADYAGLALKLPLSY